MAFDTLKATDNHFGSELPYLRDTLPDLVVEEVAEADDVPSIFLEAAREALRLDLYTEWGLDIEDPDTGVFESRVTLSTTTLKHVLATKQLEMVYAHFDQGDGSLNRDNYRKYRGAYIDLKSGFGSLGDRPGSTDVRSTQVLA